MNKVNLYLKCGPETKRTYLDNLSNGLFLTPEFFIFVETRQLLKLSRLVRGSLLSFVYHPLSKYYWMRHYTDSDVTLLGILERMYGRQVTKRRIDDVILTPS